MNDKPLVIISNTAEKTVETSINNRVSAGTMNQVFAMCFLGATLLSSPLHNTSIPTFSQDTGRYIQYSDLNWAGKVATVNNECAIDLLKVNNLNKIEKIAAFENDWNGNGGKVFTSQAISVFKEIINTLDKQPQIAPTGRNTLLMQYELEDKSLLAFEVGEKKVEKVYVPQGDYAKAEAEVFTENMALKMKESVKQFYGFK